MHRTTARFARYAVACLLVVVATAASAAEPPVPRLVRYAGVASAPGPADITFVLYAEQASETPLWTETQRVTIDETRRYAVHLGATRPEGLPAALFAAGEPRWLGVQVAGQAEQPRVLLVSVPYALKAADADSIGGKPLSAFVLAGDTTGTGADGLTYVNSRALAAGLAVGGPASPRGGVGEAGTVATAGTANYIGLFTDASNLGNSVLYQNAGAIGLNTTAPAAAFHSMAPATPGAFFDVYSDALGALPVVYRAARGTATAPTAVRTDDILGGLAVRGYGATKFSGGRGQVMFKAAENWTDAANGTYLVFATEPLGASTIASERMRITPDGNVGIGTAAPGQALSVAGIIESTVGGIKFPDGSTLATATGAIGSPALNNTATGAQALAANTTGYSNTANGSMALAVNTNGDQNTATGAQALRANTTGNSNTGTGAQALYANTIGIGNTATGYQALRSNTGGDLNTASGQQALYANTTGNNNTASGVMALYGNTTGSYNTANGSQALLANTTGSGNTGTGAGALTANTTGVYNTATGRNALNANTTGDENTAGGSSALSNNTTGNGNTADGRAALYSNTSGSANTAVGNSALYANTTGYNNAAFGESALEGNTTGHSNTAIGRQALVGNTAGFRNIAVGHSAGGFSTGDYNILIGHGGVAAESNTIRIGAPGDHTRTFITGIRGVTTGNANAIPVLIDGAGQLGTVSSSRRVKDDIADMAGASAGLMQLRPVTFHYKSDQNAGGRSLQYGLIAEEVADVYPGLIAHSADGQIETVMYQFLPPMLLNEFQKQQRTIDTLEAQTAADKAQIQTLTEQLTALAERLSRLEKR
jgi:hypothetical protein